MIVTLVPKETPIDLSRLSATGADAQRRNGLNGVWNRLQEQGAAKTRADKRAYAHPCVRTGVIKLNTQG